MAQSMPPGVLQGKTALITGAVRRVGRTMALALAEEGVNIVVHALPSEDTKDIHDELAGRGVRAWTVTADFGKAEGYEALIARAIEAAGSLDILINNASIFHPNTLATVDFDSVVQHMQVNAWAPFVLSRDFARLAGRGKIINMLDSRVSGYDWAHVAYILSKHALAVMTKMTAVQFAPAVTVNSISPGLILPPPGKDESYLDLLSDTVPLKRHGDPADIAEAALYLLKSDFLTGQIINVDGGRHIMEYDHGPHSDH